MEEIQERTLDIGVLCSSANYVGTSEYYRVIKHEYIGTRIMHCLVKGTLSRQPWFVFCVRWPGAGGIARAAHVPTGVQYQTLANVGRSSL
jgi:hypothetical protein